jgi:hypothetical protein|tara:strand:+ start:729 stop:911 length:183 start_codon:yes stop_codon:yes gene_type:complete
MKKSELIHWRLQAMLRENSFSDLKYLGVKPDSIGINQHWYMIGEHEVSCDSITELEGVEE